MQKGNQSSNDKNNDTITVRLPDRVKSRLRERACDAEMELSDFVRRILELATCRKAK